MYSTLKNYTISLVENILGRLDSIDHLKKNDMVYIQHLKLTLEQSKQMFKSSLYLFLHAIVPNFCQCPIECSKFK